jgi:branched-chain amino acid transport system substrate-binding protein
MTPIADGTSVVGFFVFGLLMNDALKIGILFSTTGPYGSMGRDARDGAELAIEELGADGRAIEPVFVDPHADMAAYLDGARDVLRGGCRHIVGTITSAARKEVIPLVEKHDGLLWYMCPYEGFEANENVIYVGGCPNQHLLPLFEYLLPRYGKRPYLVGANYVWGWEMNRLARELIINAGGEVLGERYLPLEEIAVERLVADIENRRPSFILNNLIGPSSYAFLAAVKALGDRDPAFRPENCPVVSCDLMECELQDIAPDAAVGQLCAASYFDRIDTADNLAFKARVAGRYGDARRVSSIFAGAYTAVKLCAEAILAAGSDEPQAVRRQLHAASWPTLLGPLTIDPETNHAALPFHLGRIDGDGFDVVTSRPALAADPYLTGRHVLKTPKLRVVS